MAEANRESWRVVLFTDAFGGVVTLANDIVSASGHAIVAVFTAPPPSRRRNASDYLGVVETAAALGIPTVISNRRNDWPRLVRSFDPDLILCYGFLWKVPAEVIAIPRLGTVNVHLGLLPRHRGANPIGWAFRRDDGQQGVTVHWMIEGWDAGPILAQRSLPYGDDDTFDDMFPGLTDLVPGTIRDALDVVARGEPGTPQDESLATDAPMFEPEWRFIDWSRPARQIHNQVRSWVGGRGTPKGAFGTVDGRELLILRTRLVSGGGLGNPGTVIAQDADGFLIQTGDGPLRIVAWQDGENGVPAG